MNAATQTQSQVSDREAVRWIARQLRWERTLDILRGDDATQPATAGVGSDRKAA